MKLFLGLTSILVISVMFMSLDNSKNDVENKEQLEECNEVLDRLAELGSKSLYLEIKWLELDATEKFDRLQETNQLFGEFEYLQLYLKDQNKIKSTLSSMQNYTLAMSSEEQQWRHLKALRKRIDKMYGALEKLQFDDKQLFKAINLLTQHLESWNLHRKSTVLKGVAKAIAPFKQKTTQDEDTQVFDQLEKLCSTVELVQSKDAEGLYLLSLKSALSDIEYFLKNTGKEESYNKV
ncbi:hypothetical protein [Lishizhenia sp.]|uniref:hypothetical protein n=1 Tax=Lishizhenia sp. TaxID=2497594 RepID=UPI00299D468A|nr:hypothetical protein [Lishizhenia sp.]MDX1444784.1 hypothetical protein [Lishizhenia sp.]